MRILWHCFQLSWVSLSELKAMSLHWSKMMVWNIILKSSRWRCKWHVWKHEGEMCTWCPTNHWFGYFWDMLIKCTKVSDYVPHIVNAQPPVPRYPSNFTGISMIEVSRCKWINNTKLNGYCAAASIICWTENIPRCGRNTILFARKRAATVYSRKQQACRWFWPQL